MAIAEWTPDMLAYFTWFHAMALAIALIGGVFAFGEYFSRKYDGFETDPNWEWRRGTGRGVRMRQASRAEVYSHLHRGRSYLASWKRSGFLMSAFYALIMLGGAFALPQMVGDEYNFPGHVWARDYRALGGIGSMVVPAVAVTLLAALVGYRMTFGVFRMAGLKRRAKSNRIADSLTNAERACMGLSRVDSAVSAIGMLLLAPTIAWALLCVFGRGAADAERLPGSYYSGLMLYWQAGVSAAYLLWAAAQSVVRIVKSTKCRR